MVDYKKAFEKAVKHIESELGYCPACCKYDWERDKCFHCGMRMESYGSPKYNEQLSVQCWKEIFM